MTAFASVILAALPGVGVQPEKAGAGGATGAGGAAGVFDALVESMTGGDVAGTLLGEADARTAANDLLPANGVLDPALAGASAVAPPFAPLTQTVAEGEAVAPAGEGKTGSAIVVPFMPTQDQAQAAEVVAQNAASTAPAKSGEAQTPVVAAVVADEAPLIDRVAAQPVAAPDAETPVTSPASRIAATDTAPTSDAAPKTIVQAATATATPAPTVQPAAPKAEVVAVAQAAAVAAQDASAETSASTATVATAVPAPQAPAPRTTAAQPESRRIASATAGAKSDQAAATAYLDGLDGKTANPATDAVDPIDVQPDTTPDLAAAPLEVPEAEQPEGQASGAETRAAQAEAVAREIAPPAASRVSVETVARLSADIVRKLDGRSSRFELQLDPHGLGKVDVSIEIDRDGRLTAAMSFDSAQSASDLKSRSGDLRAALEQAGFDVSDSGLSFSMASQNGGGGRQTDDQSHAWSGRAFQTAQTGLDEADARAALQSRSRAAAGGVDIRI